MTLTVLIPGYLFGKYKWGKHWLKIHIVSIVLSYYLLVGGAVNEAYLHISPLRPYIIEGSPVVGMTHGVVQLLFIVLLVYYLRKYRKESRL